MLAVRKYILLLPFFFLLAACDLSPLNLGMILTPTSTSTPPPTLTPSPSPTLTIDSQNCYFNWATHSLPDLTRQVQAAFDSVGFDQLTASAEAFGEDCIDPATNKPFRFAIMETDFRITMQVPDLTDTENLGNQLEKILAVLDGFPVGTRPGPKSGYIGVTFKSGTDVYNLWFLEDLGKSARAEGLHGAALLDKVRTK